MLNSNSAVNILHRLFNETITNYKKITITYLCDYRKDCNTEQGSLSHMKKWKKILADKGFWGTVLIDLSKAFDT